jgi:glutamate 5-kinase
MGLSPGIPDKLCSDMATPTSQCPVRVGKFDDKLMTGRRVAQNKLAGDRTNSSPVGWRRHYDLPMQGVVVINADAGRALRKACAVLRVVDVLDCSGDFRSGDNVYLTMRVRDGGQYAIATGVVRLDATTLQELKGGSVDALGSPVDRADCLVVILEQDIRLLWRTAT